MTRKILMATLAGVLCAANVFAGENIFERFLRQYRPAPGPWLPRTADDALTAMIRDGSLPLDIESTVRLLIENNLDVRVERYTPLLSRYELASAFRLFEPTLRITAGTGRSTRPTTSQLDGAAAPNMLNQNYGVRYSQTLPTGANLDVSFNVNRNSSNSVFSTFNPSYSGSLTYGVVQPLLRNAGRAITTHGIRVARNSRDISDIDFEIQLISLVTDAQLLYWDLVNTREEIRLRDRSLQLAQKTLQDNRRQVEVGTLAPIEVTSAEAEVALRQEQIVLSTFGRNQLQNRMKQLITHAADPALVLATLDPVETVRRPEASDLMPIAEAIRFAVESRPEMRRLILSQKNADIEVRFTKNQLLPAIDLAASYTQNGLGGVETVRSGLGDDAIVDVRRGGVWNAFEQILGQKFTGYTVGLTVSIPLSNKSAQAEHAQAVARQRMLDDRKAALTQAIALQVHNAHSQVEMNRASIEAAGKSIELARRQLSAEESKNRLGVSPIKFVLDAQREMTDAETREMQSLIHYAQALARYDLAVGRTLRKNNIGIDNEVSTMPAAN